MYGINIFLQNQGGLAQKSRRIIDLNCKFLTNDFDLNKIQ